MAKSTGNIARVGDLLADGVSARALRYALIAVHYRASLNYSDDSLDAAAAAIERLDAAVAALSAYREDRAGRSDAGRVARDAAREAFGAALDDDLNVSAGLAAVFDLVRDLNRRIEGADAVDSRCGRGARPPCATWIGSWASCRTRSRRCRPTPQALLDARAAARAARDWAGVGSAARRTR